MPSPCIMIQKYEAVVGYAERDYGKSVSLQAMVDDVMDRFKGQVHGCYLTNGHPLTLLFGPFACILRFNDDIDGMGCAILRQRQENVYGWDSVDLTDSRNEIARQAVSVLFKDGYPDNYDGELHIVKPMEG